MRKTSLVASALLAMVALHASAATFNDSNYHEYILYKVDTPYIDVLIIPPAADPYILRDMANIEQSIEMWKDGIDALAPTWLKNGLDIRYYTLGQDMPTEEALFDPEIIIVSGEVNPVLLAGIGLQSPVIWCHNIGPGGGRAEWVDFAEAKIETGGFHHHEDAVWASATAACDDGGRQCYVINTNFLWLPDAQNGRDMFDLNSHEFGHCLGIGHVGDALDFSAANYPSNDIMSYQSGNHVHCVSSLNILALMAVYGDLLGQSSYHQNPGTFVHMDPADYEQHACSNPTGHWLDTSQLLP